MTQRAAASDPELLGILLEPTDRSSPRATLSSFLANATRTWEAELGVYEDGDSSTLQKSALRRVRNSFDLSLVAPSERSDKGIESALMLLDVLNRIPLPELDTVPDRGMVDELGLDAWVMPGTSIELVREKEGPQAGQWLFSSNLVERLPALYEVTRQFPLRPGAIVDDGYRLYISLGGSLIPDDMIIGLPDWSREIYSGQAVWQWLSGGLLLTTSGLLAFWLVQRARPGIRPGTIGTFAYLASPALLMLVSAFSLYFIDEQLNFTGKVLALIRVILMLVYYLAGAWLAIRVCALIGVGLKRNSKFVEQAIDRDLVDTLILFISILAAVLVLAKGAAAMGIPLAGVLTGLGVGGIAVALAAQSTLENLLGGFMLFLDRPVRVGDYCRFSDREGTVEHIGLRSTRIRTLERTLISVPNSEFSKIHIESLAVRDKMLLNDRLSLGVITPRDRIQMVLDGLRAVLDNNDQVDSDNIRVRLVSLGPSALDIQVMAYIKTRAFPEFLAIREALYLEFMRVIESAGTSLAPPAQIQYNADIETLSAEGPVAKQDR